MAVDMNTVNAFCNAVINKINGLINTHNTSGTAHITEMNKKVNIAQGSNNANKNVVTSNSGDITFEDKPNLTNYIQKSSTSGVVMNDGSIKSIGTGSSQISAGHTHPYASNTHNHNGVYQPVGDYLTSASLSNYVQTDDSRLSDDRNPLPHTHLASDIEGYVGPDDPIDITAFYTKTESDNKYVTKSQGTTNNGKFLKVSNGNVVCESVTIPTNTNQLTNGAGFLTAHQDISGKANTADLATVATTGKASDLTNDNNTFATGNHTHTGVYQPVGNYLTSLPSHNHNDLYYTKSDITTQLATKTVTLEKLNTATNGYIATYELKQNNVSLGKIDIPKDFLVKSGTVKTAVSADLSTLGNGYSIGDRYIDFVINSKDNSGTDEHVYINVKDLVDNYEADNVTLQLSNGVFSIKDGGISTDKISNGAITSAKIANNVIPDISGKADTADLAEVAFSGLASDLNNDEGFLTSLPSHNHDGVYQPVGNYLTSHNPIDTALSSTSTNAVQNKIIKNALDNKINKNTYFNCTIFANKYHNIKRSEDITFTAKITDYNGNPIQGVEVYFTTSNTTQYYLDDNENYAYSDYGITDAYGMCTATVSYPMWGVKTMRVRLNDYTSPSVADIQVHVDAWEQVEAITASTTTVGTIYIYSNGRLARLKYALGSTTHSASNAPFGKTLCQIPSNWVPPTGYWSTNATPDEINTTSGYKSSFTSAYINSSNNFCINHWKGYTDSSSVIVNVNILYPLANPLW